MEIEKVNLQEKLNLFSAHWSPKIVGELNGQYVKIAKFKGEFIMHKHLNEDELFYVIQGELFMSLNRQNPSSQGWRICHYPQRYRSQALCPGGSKCFAF